MNKSDTQIMLEYIKARYPDVLDKVLIEKQEQVGNVLILTTKTGEEHDITIDYEVKTVEELQRDLKRHGFLSYGDGTAIFMHPSMLQNQKAIKWMLNKIDETSWGKARTVLLANKCVKYAINRNLKASVTDTEEIIAAIQAFYARALFMQEFELENKPMNEENTVPTTAELARQIQEDGYMQWEYENGETKIIFHPKCASRNRAEFDQFSDIEEYEVEEVKEILRKGKFALYIGYSDGARLIYELTQEQAEILAVVATVEMRN